MPKIDTNKQFYNKGEKDNDSVVIPDIDINEFEIEMFKIFKIRKEDIKRTIHLDVPDELVAMNTMLKQHGSIFAFWGMVYKYAYRKAKLSEERLNEFKSMKRKKVIRLLEDERQENKSKKKQITAADIEDKFQELYGEDETYLKLRRRMVNRKFQRDRLEVLYEVMKQRKDVLVTLSNNLRAIEDRQKFDRIKQQK